MNFFEVFTVIGSTATAALAIWAIVWGVTKWIHKQNDQPSKIDALEKKHDRDTQRLIDQEHKDFEDVRDELCILSRSVLAILDGLKQQGCNGEVTKAHEALEKYLNDKAHGQ